MEQNQRVDAYQHIRNKNCIYRRVGDTDVFIWKKYKRRENGIIAVLHEKFEPYV
jgi:hypothetical protein